MCRKGRTLSLLKKSTLSEGRKYMLRSASARICVTDTQVCTRGAILTSIEIKVSTESTERCTHVRTFCKYHKNNHVLSQLLTIERWYLLKKKCYWTLIGRRNKNLSYINFRRNTRQSVFQKDCLSYYFSFFQEIYSKKIRN